MKTMKIAYMTIVLILSLLVVLTLGACRGTVEQGTTESASAISEASSPDHWGIKNINVTSDNQIYIYGQNLDAVSEAYIYHGSIIHKLTINTQEPDYLIAVPKAAFKFVVDNVYDLVFTNAYGAQHFPITFEIPDNSITSDKFQSGVITSEAIDDMGADDGDVLTWNGIANGGEGAWEPIAAWGLASGNTYRASGNVGIGTTVPEQKLDIVGGNGRVETGSFWLTNSDARYKKNITTLESALEKVANIRGVRYDLKSEKNVVEGKGRNIGFIAQELEKEFPEFVVTAANGFKSVAYDKMTAVLVEAVKQQQLQVTSLKDANIELKKDNENLKLRLEVIEKKMAGKE